MTQKPFVPQALGCYRRAHDISEEMQVQGYEILATLCSEQNGPAVPLSSPTARLVLGCSPKMTGSPSLAHPVLVNETKRKSSRILAIGNKRNLRSSRSPL